MLGCVSAYFSCIFIHMGIHLHIYNFFYILTIVGHTVEKLVFSISIETWGVILFHWCLVARMPLQCMAQASFLIFFIFNSYHWSTKACWCVTVCVFVCGLSLCVVRWVCVHMWCVCLCVCLSVSSFCLSLCMVWYEFLFVWFFFFLLLGSLWKLR